MKLTKVQKTTRFIVYTLFYAFILGMLTGILPAVTCGMLYQIFGI